MNRIKISSMARCAEEKLCFPQNAKRERRKQWIDEHDLFINEKGRAFALVDTMSEVFFMDAVTGSLYQFGGCVSTGQLSNALMHRNKDKAGAFLMSLSSSVCEEEAA